MSLIFTVFCHRSSESLRNSGHRPTIWLQLMAQSLAYLFNSKILRENVIMIMRQVRANDRITCDSGMSLLFGKYFQVIFRVNRPITV